MGLEAVVLLGLRRWRRVGIASLPLLIILASGACLLFALRAALTGAPWVQVWGFLAASLAVHLLDLHLRWTRGPVPPHR